eukprot:TRINITY_DN103091_c0_g1_i1.p1 TRINITY_DN103091_c0_g1~~TRINITY_DN103091_c0_g1_i1.p1  ORF type:complete len:663 (+),score=142.75 TRINITY_DN103091_c0_g1_i1:100-2088(+)
MGRTADTSDDEGDGAASDEEDDGDEETALKRRKVVLVKAQPVTAEQEDEDVASKSVASSAPRVRAKPLAGGTAGRILREMLGGPRRSACDRERPLRQARPHEEEPAQTSSTVASSASTDAGRSMPPAAAARKAVDAVRRQSSAAPTKIVKTKLTKPSTESKKATLSKRSAPSGISGQKATATASATLKVKAIEVLRKATARSGSPCSPELRPAAVDHASAAAAGAGTGKKTVRNAPAHTKVQKGTTASAKKVSVKSKRPAKALSTTGASSITTKAPKATLSTASMPVRERDPSDSRASSASPSRQSSSSSSPPPARARAPEKKHTKKSRRASSPKKVRVAKPVSPSSAVPQASSPRHQALSAVDEGGFQDLVLDRLRTLCGENEDAKVLAEYIVVMVAGAKGRDEMARELKPFFQDQAQAESFVDWVEECKWKFLTGGPSPAAARTVSAAAGSTHQQAASGSSGSRPCPPADFWGPAPPGQSAASSSSGMGRSSTRQAETGGSKLRSPHVAVTSRVVLQPNPNFDDDSPPSSPPRKVSGVGVSKSAAKAIPAAPPTASASPVPFKAAVVTPKPGTAVSAPAAKSSAPAAPAPVPAARGQKNELLHNMTNQLQLILTKLQDKSLPDETREKYQALAQNIQVQMAKITTKPPASASKLPMGRRR